MAKSVQFSGFLKSLAASVIVLVAATGPARADSLDEPPYRIVQTRDLDLTSEGGQRALGRRIRTAAGNVCRSQTIGSSTWTARCIDGALRRAWSDVRMKGLTAAADTVQSQR